MAQSQVRRNTWEGQNGPSLPEARATELLHTYIYDYCKKHNFGQAAKAFAQEAGVQVGKMPPIDIPSGFLGDWWSVFWDVYNAKYNETLASKDAATYQHYTALVRSKREEMLQQHRAMSMQQQQQQMLQQRRMSDVQRQPPTMQQPSSQQQGAMSRDPRPSPANSTISLPNNGMQRPPTPQQQQQQPPHQYHHHHHPSNNSIVNTPQSMPSSLPQQHIHASPSYSPQQIQHQRPGNEHPTEHMMTSNPQLPATSAPLPPHSTPRMATTAAAAVTTTPTSTTATTAAMAAAPGGVMNRDLQSMTQEERNAYMMHAKRQAIQNNMMMRNNPNMMMSHQARLQMQQQQQLAMNQQQQQQQQPMTPQQGPGQLPSQSQPHPQQQQAMDMANRNAGMAQAGQPRPPMMNASMGMTGPGVPVAQMSGAMQHPNTPFSGDSKMLMMQQMISKGQIPAGLTPQQQMALRQQHQAMMNRNYMLQQQQQQLQMSQGGHNATVPTSQAMMMGGFNPQHDPEKARAALMNYQRQQAQQAEQLYRQQQQAAAQQQGGRPPPPPSQQQQQHPAKRPRPNPDNETSNPPMAQASPQTSNTGSPHTMNQQQPSATTIKPEQVQGRVLSQQQQQRAPFQTSSQDSPQTQPSQQQTPQQQHQHASTTGWSDMEGNGGMVKSESSPGIPDNSGMATAVPTSNSMSFDLERFMMSDGGDFADIFANADDSADPALLLGDGNDMDGGFNNHFLAGSFGGGGNLGMENAAALTLSGASEKTLQAQGELAGHTDKVLTCAFSKNGHYVVSGGKDKHVMVWSVRDKQKLYTLDGHTHVIHCARWSADDRNLVATCSFDKTIRVWDVGSALVSNASSVKQVLKFEGRTRICAVDFCPTRPEILCSMDAEGELNVWNMNTQKKDKTLQVPMRTVSSNQLRFHPRDGNMVACAVGNQLYVIDIHRLKGDNNNNNMDGIKTIQTSDSKNITSLDWSSDGNFLVTCSEGLIAVYDTVHWKMVNSHSLQGKTASCAFVNHESNGSTDKLQVIFGEYEAIYIWQCSVPGAQPKRTGSQPGLVAALACSTTSTFPMDGTTMVASASHNTKDKNLMLWSI